MRFFKRRPAAEPGKIVKKVCPICFSDKIKEINQFGGWISQIQYACEKCGYTGTLILELEGDPDKFNSLKEEEL